MRAWAFALLVILGIFAFGCIQPTTGVAPNTTTPTVEVPIVDEIVVVPYEKCADSNGVLSSDKCYLDLALESSDSLLCQKIYSIKTRDECYDYFSKTDEKLCAKIASPSLRSNCYFNSARRLNDTDYCVKISNSTEKQNCLVELSPPCSFESDVKSKNLCLALYNNASKFCADDDCRFELGTKNLNPSACDDIDESNRALRSACRAIALDDISICTESGLDVVADYCYKLAAYAASNSAWCTYTTAGSPYGLECLMHFATTTNDPTLCKYSDSELDRDNCYMNYSISTGNYSACDKIIISLLDSQCRIATAMQNGDMSSCNKMQYNSRTNCYNLVLSGAVPLVSEESCFGINELDSDPWQYRCLSQYAYQTADSSICAKIDDAKYRAECEFRFS